RAEFASSIRRKERIVPLSRSVATFSTEFPRNQERSRHGRSPFADAPSPDLFFETMNAYQRTEALKAAIELDLFTVIGEGGVTADSLASRLGVSQRGVRILCDYLVVIGFLTKRDGQYGLTPDSAVFPRPFLPPMMQITPSLCTSVGPSVLVFEENRSESLSCI